MTTVLCVASLRTMGLEFKKKKKPDLRWFAVLKLTCTASFLPVSGISQKLLHVSCQLFS
jgi:hypothetical protein